MSSQEEKTGDRSLKRLSATTLPPTNAFRDRWWKNTQKDFADSFQHASNEWTDSRLNRKRPTELKCVCARQRVLPHGVHVRRWQARTADRGAVV